MQCETSNIDMKPLGSANTPLLPNERGGHLWHYYYLLSCSARQKNRENRNTAPSPEEFTSKRAF